MPIKEGIETIIEMRKLDPRTRIIAMSGGGRLDAQDHLDMVSINLVDAKNFKPFKLQMLLDTINSLLGNDILNSCQTTTVTIPSNQLL
jgi:DNA-binding NtrC family response regulator